MPRTSIRYIHPVHGEIYIDRGSVAGELHREKKLKQLDVHLSQLMDAYNKLSGRK